MIKAFGRNADAAGAGDTEQYPFKICIMPWKKEGEPVHRAEAALSYDENALYVRIRDFTDRIVAKRVKYGEPVCCDSCLEFFFAPEKGSNAYFNFEINPLGIAYIGYSKEGTRQSSRLVPLESKTEIFKIRPLIKCGSWEISYEIPYGFIRLFAPAFDAPRPGDTLRCNFYACCDDAPVPYYSVWNMINTETPDYHRPEYFGEVIFS